MGIGLALTEMRVLDRNQTGKMVNRNWHDYKIPTAMDVPADQTVVPIDLHDYEANNAAAKGWGTPPRSPRPQPSPTPSTTRAACGLPTRPSTRCG
jgi:CO/xanthine dehydrogenase Mo-binding subunit